MREIKTCLAQEWMQLPTDELDQILQAELEKEHPNEEVVLPILKILEEREKDYPVEKTPEVLALLEKISKYDTPSKQSQIRRGWITGIAALAAVICIVVMALPHTVGAESIFDVLLRWTSSVFEFIDPDRNESFPNEDSVFNTDHIGLQQLHDKVTELGVAEPVVPMWLPEGFRLADLKISPAPNGNKVHGRFENGSDMILFTYLIYTNIPEKVEKEDSTVEVYDYADVNHVILENDDYSSVTWIIDDVDCLINANIAKEDIYTVIKSIYRGRLQ